jgi:hypothetical protein
MPKHLIQNLNMRRIAAIFMPRLLTDEPKQNEAGVCHNLQETFQRDSQFLSKSIIDDEI